MSTEGTHHVDPADSIFRLTVRSRRNGHGLAGSAISLRGCPRPGNASGKTPPKL